MAGKKRHLIIITSTTVALCLIVFFALHLHRQSKREVLSQFNERQLDVARQVARGIEFPIRASSIWLRMLASLSSLQRHDLRQIPADIQKSFEYVKAYHAMAISLFDERGALLYSTLSPEVGSGERPSGFLEEAMKPENKGKVMVSPSFRKEEDATSQSPQLEVTLATPLYLETLDVLSPKPAQTFAGLLILTLNLKELLVEHLHRIDPKLQMPQIWLMDKDGTVLFQSEHPGMQLKNIHQRGGDCQRCHRSFEYAEKILKEELGWTEYELKDNPKKLAAFAPMKFENVSWIVIVTAPYRKVVSFTTRNLRYTAWLLGIIILVLAGGLALTHRDYRLKVRAEEEAKQLREKRALEDRVKESEARYRQLVELCPDAVAVHIDGLIVFMNTAGARLLGAEDPQTLVGRRIFDFVHPDFKEIVKKRNLDMKQGKTAQLAEEKFLRLDGTVIDVEVAASALSYQGKSGVQVVVRDITERKRAEREINTLNEDLVERALELERSNKELEAFSYSVSHDLRNPLAVIGGFSHLFLEKHRQHLDEQEQNYLNIILRNTKNMEQLIDDLLNFSRLGRQALKPINIDMRELAETVFRDLKTREPARTLQLTTNSLPPAYGDLAMIRQVMVNLLSNAIKFTKSKENGVIEIGGKEEEKENVYFVKDNGAGFDMKHYDKLFAAFQRLHPMAEFEGTGVGLATVERIIQRHGGRVWAQGKVGEGATFYFALPRNKLQHERSQPPSNVFF